MLCVRRRSRNGPGRPLQAELKEAGGPNVDHRVCRQDYLTKAQQRRPPPVPRAERNARGRRWKRGEEGGERGECVRSGCEGSDARRETKVRGAGKKEQGWEGGREGGRGWEWWSLGMPSESSSEWDLKGSTGGREGGVGRLAISGDEGGLSPLLCKGGGLLAQGSAGLP